MTKPQELTYPSSDGIHTVHALQWTPQGEPRAILQLVHGIAEYVGRYDHVAQFFTRQGFLVCGEDHLGHGQTAEDQIFGYFGPENGWDYVVRDVRRLRQMQEERYPGLPYVMLGHSMGSFLTRTYLIRWPGTVDAAVLSGTGQESALLVALCRAVAGALSRLKGGQYVSPFIHAASMGVYNTKFRPNRTSGDWICRDTAVVDAYLRDPLCTFMPTVGMYRDMMGGLQYIANRENLARMDKNTPVYFFSGDHDPVGAMGKGVRKVEAMFRSAGCRDVTVRLYPQGRHEMLNGPDRQQVMEELLAWLEEKIGQK